MSRLWDKLKDALHSAPGAPPELRDPPPTPAEIAAAEAAADPLAAARRGGHALAEALMTGLRNEKGIHVETLLCALGSLGGYACQASVRETFIKRGGRSEDQVFVIATGADGKRYFYGDALNKPLAEDRYSLWSLAAGMANHLGCRQPLDVAEIFQYVASTVGGEQFGIPRIPDDHRPSDTPAKWVKVAWPKIEGILRHHCEEPAEWPAAFGFACQEVMQQAKSVIEPCLALRILMESAIPMSKVDRAAL